MALRLARFLHDLVRSGHGQIRRNELAWTPADRALMEGTALAVAPREGATIALCRRSTGASRDTYIVSDVILPQPGDLRYDRGRVVSVSSRYWNRAIDTLSDLPAGTGLAILHTHPGRGTPAWSSDDDRADAELGEFLFGEKFLAPNAPLVSLVATHTELRGRSISFDSSSRRAAMQPIERVRTVGLDYITVNSTSDRRGQAFIVPAFADRSIRVFGMEGQRRLADLHVAFVGTGGVGSICAEDIARWGVGTISCWDPDVIEDVNINRSGRFTFADARWRRPKARTLAKALRSFALVRKLKLHWRNRDVRARAELPRLLDADVIVLLVDDPRPRHFVNRLAFAHYIPVLDGGNVIRSTAEDASGAETAAVEGGGIRVSYLVPGGPCLWCAGHLTSHTLSLAYRSAEDKAADRARGYVEHLGPEHAPSVMPINAMNAGLLEVRLMNLLFGLTQRSIPELYFDILGGTLDELPRVRRTPCRQCGDVQGKGDLADLPHADD